jgi:CHAT domain-containing protein
VTLVVDVGLNQAAFLIIDQDEPSLRLGVLDEKGSEIRSVAAGFSGPLMISASPASHGAVRVVVTAPGAQTPAALSIFVEASRPTDADLAALHEAEAIFEQAQFLRRQPEASSVQHAIALLHRAGERWRDGHSQLGQAVALGAEANAWFQLSRYADALRAYAAAQQIVARGSWLSAALLNSEANVDLDLWRRKRAREAADGALHISRGFHDERGEADAMANLAIGKWLVSGDPSDAAGIQEALDVARMRGNRLAAGRLLRVLGWLERDLGHRREAIDLLEESTRLFQQSGMTLDALRDMADIASVERMRGDAYSAIGTHSKLAELFHQAGSGFHEASARTNLGLDYIALNRARDGLRYLQEGRTLYTKTGNVWAAQAPTGSACETEVLLRWYISAQADCQEAKRLAVEFHSTVHIALAEFRLGELAEARGNLAVAAAKYRSAAELSSSVGFSRRALVNLTLGLVQYRLAGPAAAMDLFQKALTLSEKAEDPAGIIEAKYQIARVYAATGRLEEAQRQLEEATGLSEAAREKIRSDRLRTSYFASVRKCYDLYVDVLMRRHAASPNAGLDREALEKSEAGRARTLFDALHLRTALPGRRIAQSAELTRLRAALNERYEVRLNLIIGGHKQRDLEANAGEIRRLNAEYEQALALAAADEQPGRAALVPIPPADLVRVSSDTIVLEYHLGEERSYLWRIERGQIASFRLPGRKTIGDAVEKWRDLTSGRQRRPGESFPAYRARIEASDRELPAQAAKLSCMLLPGLPFEKETRLTVVADGSLQSLPFAALPSGGCRAPGGPPLIALHEIANASSLRILSASVGREHAVSGEKDVAVLADPVFSAHDSRLSGISKAPASPDTAVSLKLALRDVGFSSELPRLYGTREEADAIFALSPGSVLRKVDFSANLQTALSAELSNYRIWHFATHGLLDQSSPDLSGLVFSLVDEKGRAVPGFLKIQDIFDLSIDPDLVVLSACSSGLGEQVAGEGAVGLSYAFLHAGAKQVVSTLWNVDDDASSELMKEFYRGLLKDRLPVAGALRKAQVALLSRNFKSQPFYWAGLLLMSN